MLPESPYIDIAFGFLKQNFQGDVMDVKVGFAKTPKAGSDTAVVCIYKDNRLGTAAQTLDKASGGLIRHHLKKQGKFTGAAGQVMALSAPPASRYARIVLLGLGDPAALDARGCETAGGKLSTALAATGTVKAALLCGGEKTGGKMKPEDVAAHIAMGVKLRSYSFEKYKTLKKKNGSTKFVSFEVAGAPAGAAKKYAPLGHVAEGIFWARDLVNEPPNVLYPDSFAKQIQKELRPLGVEVEILDEKKMKALGFNAHLAVGMGSAFKPRVVIMRWHGGKKKKGKAMKNPLAFVGKGLTFDTGGVNIKPSGGMEEMKLDMGGAAAVAGLMMALARRKSKAEVVGIAGLAENAVDGASYRPSDILQSMSGQTVEVMNTDAEGRLVLIDSLTYVQRKYKPRLIIDLATLTGAMMVALGSEYCGTFVNDEKLWKQMEAASAASGEKLWRMPLDEVWRREMDSSIADVRTLGNGRYAGACTAAGFLQRFIEGKTPWAHMDIAGTAWNKADTAICPKPATGFGVRILDRFIADHYET